MKKIIITGATSFLGRNVINGLLKDDCLIYALCRPNSSSVEILPENEKLNIIKMQNMRLKLLKLQKS